MTHTNNPLFSDPYAGFLELQARREAQRGVTFDPSELLHLAIEQWPFRPLVAASFALCTKAWKESVMYTHFLGCTEREALRHAGGGILDHPTRGELAVDFAFDARVEGGVRVVGIEELERTREVFEWHEHGPQEPMLRVVWSRRPEARAKSKSNKQEQHPSAHCHLRTTTKEPTTQPDN
jgi:hypothetical protein